jgi:hypothetical protein
MAHTQQVLIPGTSDILSPFQQDIPLPFQQVSVVTPRRHHIKVDAVFLLQKAAYMQTLSSFFPLNFFLTWLFRHF